MATTKIINIIAHPQRAVDYICNPKKTDEQTLIYTQGCNIHNINYTFDRMQRNVYENKDITMIWKGNKAYHLIQSFKPGEVDKETAHKIGQEWADKILEGKYSYVLSTHVDKGHIHNHIIFCSADNMGKGRYNSCTKERHRRERLNDELCKQYGLSVVSVKSRGGLTYNQWEESKKGFNWYKKIRSDIDACINIAQSYDDFIALMKDRDYVINDNRKYITFKPKDKERPVRGKAETLGEKYTREAIKERINERTLSSMFSKSAQSQTYKRKPKSISADDIIKNRKPSIIDLKREDIQASVGLTKWARKHNLNNANDLLNMARSMGYTSMQAVTVRVRNTDERIKELKDHNDKIEQKIISNRVAIGYLRDYIDLKKYDEAYKRAADPEIYFERFDSQLMLFDEAESYLKSVGLTNIDKNTLIELQNNIATLEAQQKANIDEIKRINDNIKDTRYIQEQWELFESSSRMDNIEQAVKNANKDLKLD